MRSVVGHGDGVGYPRGLHAEMEEASPAPRERDQPNRLLQPSAAGTILSRPARVLYAARLMTRSEKKTDSMGFDQGRMKNCVCLKQELVAQIGFTEWTPDGHLRHSKFVGFREDKRAREVVRERSELATIPKHFRGCASVSKEWRDRSLLRQAIKTHS